MPTRSSATARSRAGVASPSVRLLGKRRRSTTASWNAARAALRRILNAEPHRPVWRARQRDGAVSTALERAVSWISLRNSTARAERFLRLRGRICQRGCPVHLRRRRVRRARRRRRLSRTVRRGGALRWRWRLRVRYCRGLKRQVRVFDQHALQHTHALKRLRRFSGKQH